jgi:hypothetical protein
VRARYADIGIRRTSGTPSPSRTLLDWYRDGQDVAARLPWLSTYLGHHDPRSTYWYLSAAPELLALAATGLEPAIAQAVPR